MKTYKVTAGETIYAVYETEIKAEKIGISHWDELQNSNDDSGFVIDDVWEDE